MRFAFLIYLFASVTSLHAEKPFDFASTPGKLPKQVRPTEYAIWVKPDLKKLAFAGRETVKLKVAEPTRELILNALDLRITDAEIDGKTVPKTAIKFDAKNELLTIATPEELTPGEHTLAIRLLAKSINLAAASSTPNIRNKGQARRRCSSERNSRLLMRGDFSPAGMSRSFVR